MSSERTVAEVTRSLAFSGMPDTFPRSQLICPYLLRRGPDFCSLGIFQGKVDILTSRNGCGGLDCCQVSMKPGSFQTQLLSPPVEDGAVSGNDCGDAAYRLHNCVQVDLTP